MVDSAQGAASHPDAEPPPGDVLYKNERTQILRQCLANGRSVIQKQAFGAEGHRRLRHEAAILARLSGLDGVPRLVADPPADAGAADALLLEDDGGLSLALWLEQQRPSLDQTLFIATELARILGTVHRAGVIHKDINPSNIVVVGAELKPVLIDFGVASSFAEERPGFTHQSHIAGTLAYMAPEQTGRTGRAVDQRSDLYALGVTLYELTVGRKPFESEDLLEMIHDHLVLKPTAPVLALPSVPVALSNIIMRLLEKEADRRYQSADGLQRDLVRLRVCLDQGQPARSFALGQDDFPLRLTPPTSLIGRDSEIAALQDAVDGVARGAGHALLVSGAPGVGKSVLINELQPMVTARRGWFVSGKFEQYQRDTTSAFVQTLRALGRLLLAEPPDALELHRERILQALGANAGLGPSLLPEFLLLLGPLPGIEIDDPVEAETRMIQATVDLLKSVVSPERPLVMVVDDLQWAPAISLRFMDALMTSDLERHGLLLVGAYRSNEVDAAHPLASMLARWGKLGVAPAAMQLDNLQTGAIGALIGEMLRLPQRAAARLGATIHERTEGNPYDTVELINALRQDGLLAPHDGGWRWDDGAILQYVGDCDVVGLLSRRIDRLPAESQHMLELLACLGGEVNLPLLEVASGTSAATLEAHLAPALEDGLIVAYDGHEREIRFRHDRVQQAMQERMTRSHSETGVRLALARRLAAHPKLRALAARQYLPAHAEITDATECRQVIELFHTASVISRVINYDLCERLLSAAIALMARIELHDEDRARLFKLQASRHAALYGLGRLEEADAVYATIVATQPDPETLADVAAVQIASLGNRSLHKEAVALGLALLKDLGLEQPDDLKMAIGMALFKMATWIAGTDKDRDLDRPELDDPRLLALAKVLSKTQVAAFFCAAKVGSWLTMESHRLWVDHGPCPALTVTLCSTPMQLIAIAEDYQGAYTLSRHLLAVATARRYEPAASIARFMYAFCCSHWFEPLEASLPDFRKAREGLFQAGELQYGVYTYAAWSVQFDTARSIDECQSEIEGAFSALARTSDANFHILSLPSRQLYRTLTGCCSPDHPPGSFTDENFDEAAHAAAVATPSSAGAWYHMSRIVSAAIFDDAAALKHHTAASMPLIMRAPGNYITARAHVFRCLSLAQQIRALPADEHASLLAELDKSLKWVQRRATDSPCNFLHLQRWVEAERAWAVGEHWAAIAGFTAAMNEVAKRSRPWHSALITERAARFHLAQGMQQTGMHLLSTAHDMYATWGATAKVARLEEEVPALRSAHVRKRGASASSTIVSTDMVDTLSVLRASQALSSETSLERLNDRVSKVLSTMTGAASVLMVVRSEDAHGWQVFVPLGDTVRTISLDDAAAQGKLPLSAFRYAERTREPLLLNEATHDERFARDAYFAGVEHSSMLLVPVLSHGDLRAVLVLENRLSRGAFSADRLDNVTMIAGQLAVSLDNALLYASLERKVAERTAALEEANRRLEHLSTTDALTGLSNRRHFNDAMDTEWLRALRAQTPIGFAIIDIDNFKLYNDHYGHQGGDACLKLVADAMKTGLRKGCDLVARYGGEEFVLLLPGTDLEGTLVVAERVRQAVFARQEPHAKSGEGVVTVSIGVASFVPTQDTSINHYIEQADAALYESKRAGRNRVTAAPA